MVTFTLVLREGLWILSEKDTHHPFLLPIKVSDIPDLRLNKVLPSTPKVTHLRDKVSEHSCYPFFLNKESG